MEASPPPVPVPKQTSASYGSKTELSLPAFASNKVRQNHNDHVGIRVDVAVPIQNGELAKPRQASPGDCKRPREKQLGSEKKDDLQGAPKRAKVSFVSGTISDGSVLKPTPGPKDSKSNHKLGLSPKTESARILVNMSFSPPAEMQNQGNNLSHSLALPVGVLLASKASTWNSSSPSNQERLPFKPASSVTKPIQASSAGVFGTSGLSSALDTTFPPALIDEQGTANVKVCSAIKPSGGLKRVPESTNNNAAPTAPPKYQRWMPAEDDLLLEAIKQTGGPPYNWKLITSEYFLNRRTEAQIKSRWKRAVNPSLNLGEWTEEEDKIIIDGRQKGLRYSHIAKQLPGRLAEKIRDRWVSKLDPTLKDDPWTREERELLVQAVQTVGTKWSKIAPMFPGRSETACKNHWFNGIVSDRRREKRIANDAEKLELLEQVRSNNPLAKGTVLPV